MFWAGLFSPDMLSNWFSAVALMHGLIENPGQKEQLLRVLLATNIGSSPVSLLHQCTLLLQQSTKLQSKVIILKFGEVYFDRLTIFSDRYHIYPRLASFAYVFQHS